MDSLLATVTTIRSLDKTVFEGKFKEFSIDLDPKRKGYLFQLVEDHLLFSKTSVLFQELSKSINKIQGVPAGSEPEPGGPLVIGFGVDKIKICIQNPYNQEGVSTQDDQVLFQLDYLLVYFNTDPKTDKTQIAASLQDLLVTKSVTLFKSCKAL
jgi:hypothetical protein